MTGPFEGAARLRTTSGAVTVLGAGVLLAVAACSGSGSPSGTAPAATATHSPVALSSGPASALQEQYQEVITTVLPSVVQINTETGTGSGVVYDSNGDIVTNAHVVGDATTVKVFPATGGATLQAKVLGTFTADDLAVIRVTSGAGSLSKATFGNSTNIAAGEIVLAMGNPLGLTGSVTQGIISATGRTVSEASASGGGSVTLADTLQTSAAINGGNSGGALVNLAGQVIGIPTAAARDPEAGAAPGIGFAMGVERAVELLIQAQRVPPAAAADVYVVVNGTRAAVAGPGIVERLRDGLPGLRFELNLGGGNFKTQFRRADRSGAALALIIGDDELARGVVGVKPLRLEAGQTECPIGELAAGVAAVLRGAK